MHQQLSTDILFQQLLNTCVGGCDPHVQTDYAHNIILQTAPKSVASNTSVIV